MTHRTRDRSDPADEEGETGPPPAEATDFVDEEGVAWRVRPYEPDDREPLLETYFDFDPDQRAQGVPPLTDDRIVDWLDALLEDGRNFVAASGGRVVGHALYTPTDAPEPELAVFVHQNYQNRGIGTELCRRVVEAAAAADRDALVLEVEPRNRIAIRVYEKLGFERVENEAAERGRRTYSLRMRHPLVTVEGDGAAQSSAFGD